MTAWWVDQERARKQRHRIIALEEALDEALEYMMLWADHKAHDGFLWERLEVLWAVERATL